MNKNNSNILWYQLKGNPTILETGHLVITSVHPNRILPYWVLGVVVAGQRTIKVENNSVCLTAGDYFLLPPNVQHYGIEEDNHNAYFIHFYMDGLKITPVDEINTNNIILPIFGSLPNDIDIIKSFSFIHEQFNLKIASKHFLNIQLISTLYQISFYAQKRKVWTNRYNKVVDEIMDFISDNYTKKLDYTDFEKEFNLSYRQLNNIFKRKYKTTIKQKVIERRIQHAFNLLMLGESISNAAANSGFSDYFYFIKAFKKAKNITPNELKRKYFIDT